MILIISFTLVFILATVLQFIPQVFLQKAWDVVKMPLAFATGTVLVLCFISGVVEVCSTILNIFSYIQ